MREIGSSLAAESPATIEASIVEFVDRQVGDRQVVDRQVVETTVEGIVVGIGINRAADREVEITDWGRLEWMVSGRLGNSTTLTVGKCYIKPGCANPPHYHPNCDEVLHVLHGHIEHRVDDDYVAMSAGDTISIPAGHLHNARNIGEEEAEFVISFSSADRQTVGEI